MAEAPAPEEHPAWSFALAFYDQPGVSSVCLELQDAHELDVPVVLVMLWLANSHQASVSTSTLDTVLAKNSVLRAWIAELRVIRRRLKDALRSDEDLVGTYRAAQRTELEAEKVWVRRLGDAFALARDGNGRAEASAILSLRRYAERAGATDAFKKLETLAGRLRTRPETSP